MLRPSSRAKGEVAMQDAPSVAPEQALPVMTIVAIAAVVIVAVALIWWMRKTRGGRTPPRGS
ncbi:MAG TPA: hypothetical protein VFY80_03855, partial [Burkholderiales bacterium]|nr:hypothetical protein [Burkholderiales bacterium]